MNIDSAMKPIPTFIIAICLFGLCLYEKEARKKAVQARIQDDDFSLLTEAGLYSRPVTVQVSLSKTTKKQQSNYRLTSNR